MEYSRNERNQFGRDDQNKMEILEIFEYLNGKLPDGCKVNEGHIQIKFPDQSKRTHGFRKKNQLPKKDTKDTMTKDDLVQICHQVQKLSKHLYRGWMFTRIIIRKDDHLYDILGGLARMAEGSKYSRRMDDQDQKDWSQKEYLPYGWKSRSGSHVGKVNASNDMIHVGYTAAETIYVEEHFDIKTEDDLKKSIATIVYQEGNSDVDPYNAVIDTGCPKTVCGKTFMDAFIASKDKNIFIRRKYENQSFKFGDGKVYSSDMSHEIEVEIGGFKTTLETSDSLFG